MFTYISYKIQVTEEILKMLIEDEEYLAVYFSGPCDDPDDDCAKILEDLESVDSTMQVKMIGSKAMNINISNQSLLYSFLNEQFYTSFFQNIFFRITALC